MESALLSRENADGGLRCSFQAQASSYALFPPPLLCHPPDTPRMPARLPKVLHSPKRRPACRGAMSLMFATNPAWPAAGGGGGGEGRQRGWRAIGHYSPHLSTREPASRAGNGWLLGWQQNPSHRHQPTHSPREVMPRAAVMHSRARGGEMFLLASTTRAATGPRKATVWMPLRTFSTGTPRRTCRGADGQARR